MAAPPFRKTIKKIYIMKKYLLILIAFLGVLHVNAQLNNSMKVVVSDKGDLVGR